jgi:hypothetical protein
MKPESVKSTDPGPWRDFSNGLTPLEISAGMVTGRQPGVEPLPLSPGDYSPGQALDDVILPALARPPCLVSFSGGRDSSAILAVATRLARRESLPLPIPATLRFPKASATAESEWQDAVIRHLDLPDRIRLDFDDELDIIGPVAAHVLRQHGLLWPDNSFFHSPILEVASGGSMLSGLGGDEVFGARWPLAVAAEMLRSGRPSRTLSGMKWLMLDVMYGALPLRFARRYHRKDLRLAWLRPEAQRDFYSALEGWHAASPNRFDSCLRTWWWPSRYLQTIRHSLARLGETFDVKVVHPFSEPGFLAALATAKGWKGFPGRADAMRLLFGDLLPDDVLVRRRKALFDQVFLNRHARAFIESWSGAGIDENLVDPDAIRATWAAPEPHGWSLLLLQAAWLASQPALDA